MGHDNKELNLKVKLNKRRYQQRITSNKNTFIDENSIWKKPELENMIFNLFDGHNNSIEHK